MDLSDLHYEGPDDSEEANRWRGVLFKPGEWNLWDVTWRDKNTGCLEGIAEPRSVTFPICSCCGRIIWTWPHFEEPVEGNLGCDHCAREAMEGDPHDEI